MPVITKASTAALFLLCGGDLQPQLHCTVDAVNPQKRDVTLTTECKTDGSSAHYEETLSGSGSTMIRNTVSNTGCPNHVNWAINPNSARYISSDAKIPAYPMLIDSSSGTTDLRESAGSVGVMLNGVSLFSAWAGDGLADSYKSSATYLEGDTFDLCGGHATATGWYHYHNTAGCLQEQAMAAAQTTADDHSPQIGWSYDGFPIYGQLGPYGVEMLVCGNEGADETYCLDMCNGYEGVLDGVDNFKYRYYLSCGFDELYFPLTTNCYRGCCPSGISCERHVENCAPSATAGYTSDYSPGALQSLDEIYDSELISGDDTNMVNTENSMDCSLYMGSYGVTDNDDDDEDGGYSGAARSHQSIELVGTLSVGLLAAMTTAIITALYVIFLIELISF